MLISAADSRLLSLVTLSLVWFFWLIHKNPEVDSRILSELNEISSLRECKKEKEPCDVVFTKEELKKMVYLEAATSESLRLYPPVPINFKEVQEDDIFPDGTSVKKDGWALHSIYMMGQTESIWGEDCLEFKSERWIRAGEIVSDSQFKYAAINAAPRLCVGKKYAFMQMKLVAASILLRYQVRVVNHHKAVPKLPTIL